MNRNLNRRIHPIAEADGLYDFDRAAEVFESIKTYKDSEVMINECFYQKAITFF